jgi:hypothetical protein
VTITGAEVAAEAAGIPVPTPTLDPETLLPHRTEEPTGQMPAVLKRDEPASTDPLDQIPAPVWREDETDYTVHDEQIGQIIGNVESIDPLDVELEDAPVVETSVVEAPRPTQSRAERLRQSDQKLLKNRATRTAPPKDIRKATVTGVLAALFVVGVFLMGPIPVVILVSAVLAAAIAEIYAAFRSAGTRPATLLGVLATVRSRFPGQMHRAGSRACKTLAMRSPAAWSWRPNFGCARSIPRLRRWTFAPT